VALVTRQSLREISEHWTDEDLVTFLQLLEEQARASQKGGRRGR
jgi:hypothetical protein